MRIIAGHLRGRPIPLPPVAEVRPTSSRTREAVFNLLAHHAALREHDLEGVQGKHMADICCGSGALGFEALSRGAAFATFVDSQGEVLKAAQQTATRFGVQEQCRFVRADALTLPTSSTQHAIALLDPPYGKGMIPPLLGALHQQRWLAPMAVVVAECGEREVCVFPPHYQMLDERRYGAAKILLLLYQPH